MKKIVLVFCVFMASYLCGQDLFYPQLSFYSYNTPLPVNGKNDVEEYEQIIDILIDDTSESKYSYSQYLDMIYRMYEIERTSVISYGTYDKGRLLFLCKDMPIDGVSRAVNFGAPLILNESSLFDAGYKLRFGSPVTTIDPALFSPGVKWVRLPSTANLTYESSPSIWTGDLEYIEGQDVVNRSALITKDKTLVVAATMGKEHYQIPEGVQRIGSGAFRGTWLSSIVIPSSVTAIGDKAFDCSLIKNYFLFSETIPSIGDDAFGLIQDYDAKLYVPKKVLGKYKNTYPDLKNNLASIEKNKGIYYLCIAKSEYDNENYSKAVELFELAAKNKCHEANYWLGNYYTSIDRDPKKAYSYFEKAAKKNHAKSMFMCHYYPLYYSDPKDIDAAIKWLKLAIKNDYKFAAYTLGDIYSDVDHEGYTLKLQDAIEAYKIYDYSDKISRVENLILLGADKRMKFNPNAGTSHINDEVAQLLLSSFREKNDFCLYDMTIVLINEYDVDEEDALYYCKDLINQWIDTGVVSLK